MISKAETHVSNNVTSGAHLDALLAILSLERRNGTAERGPEVRQTSAVPLPVSPSLLFVRPPPFDFHSLP